MRRRSAPPRKTGRREGCGNGGCYVSQTEQQASKESGIVGGGKVEIQNQDSHFFNAPNPHGRKKKKSFFGDSPAGVPWGGKGGKFKKGLAGALPPFPQGKE